MSDAGLPALAAVMDSAKHQTASFRGITALFRTRSPRMAIPPIFWLPILGR